MPQPAGTTVRMHAPSTYILAYLEECNGTLVQRTKLGRVLGETNYGQLILPEGNGPQDLITVSFDQLKKYVRGNSHPAKARHPKLGDSLNQWIIQVQDVITSSFVYSLILIAVIRRAVVNKVRLI